jgi:nicotinamide mononucleotide adenylyltransferase
MDECGVIHGRFQILHNDHLNYLLAGKSRCRHLVVGVTNPDPTLTRDEPADHNRSSLLANPLTYFERYTMVRRVLLGTGMVDADFSIVPFPINLPELYQYYLPLDATFYLTIYDEWGKRKLERFHEVGLKTEVLWTRDPENKGLCASDIRNRMILGEAWGYLVPQETERLMRIWRVPERLKKLHEAGAVRMDGSDQRCLETAFES